MLVTDLEKLVSLEHLATASDGRVAVVESRMEFTGDRYFRRIILVGVDGRRIPLTGGPFDSRPRWSPDGTRLGFLRRIDADAKAQLAVINVGGGEADLLTDLPLGVTDFRWSPDGRQLVVVGTEWIPAFADLDDEERARRPRRIATIPYRADSAGWTHDRRSRLWLVDGGGDSIAPLTDGAADENQPAWSPDGSTVAFLSDRTGRKLGSSATEIWEVQVEERMLTKRAELGYWTALSYRPDGVLHTVGIDDFDDWPAPLGLWRSDGTDWRNLTAHLDRTLTPSFADVTWVGMDAVLLLDDRGSTGIIRVEPEGLVHHMARGDFVVTACGAAPEADRIMFVASTMADPGEVRRLDLSTHEASVVTDANADFRAAVPLVEGQHFEVLSNGVELDAWAYLPEGDASVPLLLNIHGGPAAQYGKGFFDEFQVYVAAGYGVIACNPHGSSGRGRDFLKAVTGNGWGVVDLVDVQAVVEAALDRYPRLDPERMGVMGGSYGGFLTAWLIGHDSRYRSAIVERGLLSWPSFAGTSDIGATFPEQYVEGDVPAKAGELWDKSPISISDRVSTPTLIVHSEDDQRCPISQAEEYFTALLKAGTTTELLRFPGESHELTRSGEPRHRRERFEAILDWHERFLAAPSGPAKDR